MLLTNFYMRRILCFLIMCLSLSVITGQAQILNDKKQIDSYFSFRANSFNKEYYKLMSLLMSSETSAEQKASAEKKLLKLFARNKNSSDIDVYNCANYQLGHYYAFDVLDPFYADNLPSDMDREHLTPVDKHLALVYLDKVPHLFGRLKLIPNTWLTDYEKGLGMSFHGTYLEPSDEMFNYFLSLPDFHPHFVECLKYMREPRTDRNSTVPSFRGTMFLIKLLCSLPEDHPCKSQLLPSMRKEDIVSLALSMQKSGYFYEAVYYGFLAAFRGDVNGLIVGVDAFEEKAGDYYKDKYPNFYETGEFFRLIKDYMQSYSDYSDELKPYKSVFEQLNQHYDELADEFYREVYNKNVVEKLARKEARAQRRKERWNNIWRAIGQAMVQMGNLYVMSQYSTQYTPQYTPQYEPQFNGMSGGGLNALIDPRYAMNQVNNQYYNEYLLFSTYNKKPDGSNYTFDEYMSLNAQALNNLKKQGVDLVAELRQQNEENREQFKKDIDEDRKNRLKQMQARSGGGASETPAKESNTGGSTGGSKKGGSSSQTGGSSTVGSLTGGSSTGGVDEDPKVDAKEQFKTDPVSSSDYRKLKTVTLYARDGDHAKVMFQNVELYRKGVTDYIKLGNTFYPRRSPNWQRFQHAIAYGGTQLYYND